MFPHPFLSVPPYWYCHPTYTIGSLISIRSNISPNSSSKPTKPLKLELFLNFCTHHILWWCILVVAQSPSSLFLLTAFNFVALFEHGWHRKEQISMLNA